MSFWNVNKKNDNNPTDNDSNRRLDDLYDEFIASDFVYLCAKIEKELDFYVEIFEGQSVEKVHNVLESKPEIRRMFLANIHLYDSLTTDSRLMDLKRPFVREDYEGYRYNELGWVVCYPKRIYDEKRKDYLNYYQKLKKFIIHERAFI